MATRRKLGVISRSSRITTSRSSKLPNDVLPPETAISIVQLTHQEINTSSPADQRKSSTSSSVHNFNDVFDQDDDGSSNSCCCNWSTPKAKRFRIPEIESCPPAPKKQRMSTNGSHYIDADADDELNKCSLLRRSTSIPFFKPSTTHELSEFFFGSVSPFKMCLQF